MGLNSLGHCYARSREKASIAVTKWIYLLCSTITYRYYQLSLPTLRNV